METSTSSKTVSNIKKNKKRIRNREEKSNSPDHKDNKEIKRQKEFKESYITELSTLNDRMILMRIALDKKNSIELIEFRNKRFLTFKQFYTNKKDIDKHQSGTMIGVRTLTIKHHQIQNILNTLIGVALFIESTDNHDNLNNIFHNFKRKITEKLFITTSLYKERCFIHLRVYERKKYQVGFG